jgi:hypothetical protein
MMFRVAKFVSIGEYVQPSCTQSNHAWSAQREPSAFLGGRGSETSQTRSCSRPSQGSYKDSGCAVFFFFFFPFIQVFFLNFSKTKKWRILFFLAEKSSFYLYWEI